MAATTNSDDYTFKAIPIQQLHHFGHPNLSNHALAQVRVHIIVNEGVDVGSGYGRAGMSVGINRTARSWRRRTISKVGDQGRSDWWSRLVIILIP